MWMWQFTHSRQPASLPFHKHEPSFLSLRSLMDLGDVRSNMLPQRSMEVPVTIASWLWRGCFFSEIFVFVNVCDLLGDWKIARWIDSWGGLWTAQVSDSPVATRSLGESFSQGRWFSSPSPGFCCWWFGTSAGARMSLGSFLLRFWWKPKLKGYNRRVTIPEKNDQTSCFWPARFCCAFFPSKKLFNHHHSTLKTGCLDRPPKTERFKTGPHPAAPARSPPRKPSRGSLRLSRRQGDRNRAIRVQQEPLRFYEEAGGGGKRGKRGKDFWKK